MSKKLVWTQETDFFGTKVWLQTKDQSYKELVAENLKTDPLSKLNTKLKDGYLFRNPRTDVDTLASVFETVESLEGPVNLWAELDDKTKVVTTYARIQDAGDATMFAFAQVETFQKWSDEKDKEERKEAKRKPQKLKVNKDGTVRVKVTATSLTDIEE